MKLGTWPHNAPVVRTGLGRIHRQGQIWYAAARSPVTAAAQFLFRPRPWVRAIGDCIMRTAGLAPQRFISIHIRHSVEKAQEGKKLGASLPSLKAYHPLARALARDLDTRKVFLQTASPDAVADFSAFAQQNNLEVSYTDNPRSEHDAWGGWLAGSEMLQAAVGAVNAYISSCAAVTGSPGISLWTDFLRRTSPSATPGKAKNFRCPPSKAKTAWISLFGLREEAPLPAVTQACTQDA